MGFFGDSETPEEKARKKEQAMLGKYRLTSLTDPEDIASVKEIVTELMGTGMMEAGAKLGGGNERALLKVQMIYQRTLIEQNFIIIRQLDRIAKALQQPEADDVTE